MTVNMKLKYARELKGWSQAKVAQEIGTTPNSVSHWERGQFTPSPYFRDKLCILFGKNTQELGFLDDVTQIVRPGEGNGNQSFCRSKDEDKGEETFKYTVDLRWFQRDLPGETKQSDDSIFTFPPENSLGDIKDSYTRLLLLLIISLRRSEHELSPALKDVVLSFEQMTRRREEAVIQLQDRLSHLEQRLEHDQQRMVVSFSTQARFSLLTVLSLLLRSCLFRVTLLALLALSVFLLC